MVLVIKLNGYASVGHLFEIQPEQYNEGYKNVLAQLVNKIFMGLDETIVDRKGFRQFSNFFHHVPVSVESASKFLRGILKRHEVNDFSFQLTIEKLVWRLIKSYYIKRQYFNSEREELAFRLFCLFNRFCDTEYIPMVLNSQAIFLLYSWLNIPEPPKESKATFGNILHHILQRRDAFLTVLTKKCYDQYVRDILVEDRLIFRLNRIASKNGSTYYKKEKPTTKLVSLSSSFIRVYEDDSSDPDFTTIPMIREPRTKVIFEISMYGAKVNIETKRQGLIFPDRSSVISIECCASSQSIELMFDKYHQQTGFFEWNKCIKESEDILDSKINRLSHAQLTLLNARNRQYYRRINTPHIKRKHANLERTLSHSWDNLKDIDQSIPNTPTKIPITFFNKCDFSQYDSDAESDSSYFMFENNANDFDDAKHIVR